MGGDLVEVGHESEAFLEGDAQILVAGEEVGRDGGRHFYIL